MTEIRQRVVCYITRNRRELLVFEHDDPGLQAGVQVVAGGIDEGETPAEAAIREALEEAGLNLENPVFLGSIDKHWTDAKTPNQHWHFYWLEAPTDTPDAWDHTVTAGEDDMGMVYRQRFVKLEEVKLDWGLDVEIPELKKQMRSLERVVCYVTRGKRELLMYQPTGDWFLAWPYTFLGDLLEGESPKIAALRLVFQDAGLKLDTPELLGAFQRPVNTGLHPNQLWHFFWLEAPIETSDVLNQDVSIDVFGNSEVIYKYQQQFVKLEDVNLSLGQQQFYPVLWEKLLSQISSFYLSHELERRNKYSNSTREDFGFEFVSFLFSFVFERFHILHESIFFWDQNAAHFGRIGNQIEIRFTLFENGDKRWSCGCNFQKPNKDAVILNFELRKTNGVYFVYACSDFDYHDHPEGIPMDFLVESEIRQVTKTSNPILEAITVSNEVIFSTEVINSILDQRIDPQKVFSTYRYLEMKHKNLKALYEALEALT